LMFAVTYRAQAQPTSREFAETVATYQQAPSVSSYENVIKMAATMETLPSIPTEARRHFVIGATLFKDGKTADDFKQASDEFLQAVRLAPWWPDALYNLALSIGASGDYATAITHLKWYQMFKLSAAEAQAAQEKSWAFEAKQIRAAKDKEVAAQKAVEDQRAQQQAAAENKAKEEQDFLRKIDGARYVRHSINVNDQDTDYTYDVSGDVIKFGYVRTRVYDPRDPDMKEVGIWRLGAQYYKIQGRTLCGYWSGGRNPCGETGFISDDGRTITINFPNGFRAVATREN